jgi:hypothetical protein
MSDPLTADLAARGWGPPQKADTIPGVPRTVLAYEDAPEPAYALHVEATEQRVVIAHSVYRHEPAHGGWIAAPRTPGGELPTVNEAAGAWEAWQATGPEELRR